MKTVSIVSVKGGAGKTTLALNLALASWTTGRRTMVVDVDSQTSCLAAFKARGRPGPQCVSAVAGKLFQIQQTALRNGVEVLVIDTPGRANSELAEAVRIADLCIAVSRPTFLDLAAVAQTIETVRQLRRQGVVVLNQASPKRGGTNPPSVTKALSALRQTGFEVADTIIRARTAYQTSIAQGLGVAEWGGDANATLEIAELWQEVESRASVPFEAGPIVAFS